MSTKRTIYAKCRMLLALALIVMTLFTISSCDKEKEVVSKTSIDVYIIAGQSNAVGHTKISDRKALLKDMPQLEDGYKNVLYTSHSRMQNQPELEHRFVPWQGVTLDLGRKEGFMGPEVGMAKVLSKFYEKTDSDVGFIKCGHGGTSLLNHKTGIHANGNWVSPSYAEYLKVSYKEDDITGKLYRDLITSVYTSISELKDLGYTQINIKGLYWMQGETDLPKEVEYEIAFKFFVQDIRRDLSAKMKEFTNSDDDLGASNLPILIGAVSSGFNLIDENREEVTNKPFIDMQKKLPSLIDNCYLVDNSTYMITDYIDGKLVVYGSDKMHWNQDQMLSIGEDIGNIIIEHCY